MIIDSIIVGYFRTFKAAQQLELERNPGLYFMTGDNLSEPALQANDVGKTSLWEALCWGFYDATSEGLRAAEVANWENPHPIVEILGQFNGEYGSILRQWGPKKLQWEAVVGQAQDISQEELEKKIGITYEQFLHSIFHSQKNKKFVDLSPPDRTDLFSSVLNADVWLEFSDRADKEVKTYNLDLLHRQTQLARLNGRREEAVREERDYRASKETWEEDRRIEIKDIVAQYSEIGNILEADNESLGLLVEEIDVTEQQLKFFREEIFSANTDITTNQRQLEQHLGERYAQANAKKTLDLAKAFFTANSQCSECLQEISQQYKHMQLAEISRKLEAVETTLAFHQGEENRIRRIIADRNTNIIHLQHKGDGVIAKQAKLTKARDEKQRDITAALALLTSLCEKETELRFAVNLWKEKEQRAAEYIQTIDNEITACNTVVDNLGKAIEKSKFWIKGFKDIRLDVIEKALKQFELEANASMHELGLVDWSVQFSMDKESAGKNLQRKFHIFVYSPYNKDPVRWELWGGGAGQRIRVAVEMGLSNLILNGIGITSNIEVWDEPTNFLSEQGVDDLLSSLQSRATLLERQVWLIDHRSLEYGGFEKTITVVKDSQGSRLV